MGMLKNRDAYMAGYSVTPVTRSNKTKEDAGNNPVIDIRLNRSVTNYQYFFNNCLVTVNGYYHRIDTDNTSGIFVYDAMASLNHCKYNQVGISSFEELGGVTTLSFTDKNTWFNSDGTVLFKVTNLTGKSLLVSFCGVMLVIDGKSLFQVGDDTYKLDINTLPIREMYYEMRKYLDLSDHPIEHSPFTDSMIDHQQLLSDASIKFLIKMSQSFIIVVNSPKLIKETIHVRRTGIYGQYIAYSKPDLPLVVGYGRHAEYWYRSEEKQWSISVVDNTVDREIFNTVPKVDKMTLTDQRVPEKTHEYSKAYLLKLSNN